MKKIVKVIKCFGEREFEYRLYGRSTEPKEVIDIQEHNPQGEGDVHYCLVKFKDNTSVKVCRPDIVVYEED